MSKVALWCDRCKKHFDSKKQLNRCLRSPKAMALFDQSFQAVLNRKLAEGFVIAGRLQREVTYDYVDLFIEVIWYVDLAVKPK